MTIQPFISKFDSLPTAGENWLAGDNRKMLAAYMSRLCSGANVLEIGSWLGRSACFILEVNPKITLYCLDSWHTPDSADGSQNKDGLFDQFIANMHQLGCLEKIKVIRDESKNVMNYLPEGSFEAVYIDGSHLEEDVYQDFHNAYRLLKPGGFLLGDDWNWNSVSKGVMRAFWEINQEAQFLWPIRATSTSYHTYKICPVPWTDSFHGGGFDQRK